MNVNTLSYSPPSRYTLVQLLGDNPDRAFFAANASNVGGDYFFLVFDYGPTTPQVLTLAEARTYQSQAAWLDNGAIDCLSIFENVPRGPISILTDSPNLARVVLLWA